MTENPTEKALVDQIGDLLQYDPACCGRVTVDTIERIAALTRPPAGDGEAVQRNAWDGKDVLWIGPNGSFIPHAIPNSGAEDGVEAIARIIHEADPAVGCTWDEWVAYAEAHPMYLQGVEHTRQAARAVVRHRLTSANTVSEREKALEEAAKVAESFVECDDGPDYGSATANEIAAAIRSLSHTKEG